MANYLYTVSTGDEVPDSGRPWSAGGVVDTDAPIIAVVPTADIEDEDGNELKAGETYLMTPSVLPYTLGADVQTDIPNMSVANPQGAAGNSWSTSGEKYEDSAGPFFANGTASTTPFTFDNVGAGDKLLVVKTSASYDGVVDVHVGTTAGANDLADIDDIVPGNIGERVILKGLADGVTYHVTVLADGAADTESIDWCVVDPFRVVENDSSQTNRYTHLIESGAIDLTTYTGGHAKITIESVGTTVVTYGAFNAPETITIGDGETLDFNISAVKGYHLVDVDEPIDYCGINEFLETIGDYKLYISHEDTGGHTINASVYTAKTGLTVPATYENLQNATDNGSGGVVFAGGTNSVYNKRANTVEILRDPGDWIQFSTGQAAQFESLYIGLSTDPDYVPHADSGFYRFLISPNFYRLFGPDNTILSEQNNESGTYRFTRTLYGFLITRNGVTLFESPEVCNNYGGAKSTTVVDGDTGYYRLTRHEGATSIANTNDTVIDTGHQLTENDGRVLKVQFEDDTGAHMWGLLEVNVDDLFRRFDAGQTNLSSSTVFDNDFPVIMANSREDLEAGKLLITDNGREQRYLWSELWIAAPQRDPIIELQGVTTFSTTAAFQNVGDADSLITGEDGSQIHVEYGDNIRDSFLFLDGVARSERKGYSTYDLEFQVVSGQVQVRHLSTNPSGIVKAWYEHPPGVTRLPAPTNNTVTDTLPQFTAGGAAKTGFLTLADGRPYTVITDDAGTTEVIERVYDGAKYPFIEIEVVKDAAAAAGVYLRSNTPGSGRQSQLRFSVVEAATFVANSGANTSLPIVLRELETEDTIKYLVNFTEAAGTEHNELEIAPAGTELDLTITAATPPRTGTLGVVSVALYSANPL